MVIEMDGMFFIVTDNGDGVNLYPRLAPPSVAATGFTPVDHGDRISAFGRAYEVNALDGMLELVLLSD